MDQMTAACRNGHHPKCSNGLFSGIPCACECHTDPAAVQPMTRYGHHHTCTECGTQGPPCECHDYTPDWACSAQCAEQANARERENG